MEYREVEVRRERILPEFEKSFLEEVRSANSKDE